MRHSQVLHRQGVRGAFTVRSKVGISTADPVCVYDLAERLGVEVKFCAGSSFGGMYAKPSETILVPAERPPGRQAFTCAHELGHWFYKHGTRLDDVDFMDHAEAHTPDERLANTFASYLLMPPRSVKQAFLRRGWVPTACTPLQMYIVAVQLGVGYTTLIRHLGCTLKAISNTKAEALLKITPKKLRKDVLQRDDIRFMAIADKAWTGVSIDIQVGDIAVLPLGVTVEGKSVETIGHNTHGLLVQGRVPGISRVELHRCSWAAFVRVSRQGFEGRSQYRHLEDPDADDSPGVDQRQ